MLFRKFGNILVYEGLMLMFKMQNSYIKLPYTHDYKPTHSQSSTNKMQRFSNLFISARRSTCFRRFFRPSSGAQNCTYSVRYLSDQYLTLCEYVQDAVHVSDGFSVHHQELKTAHTASGIGLTNT